MNFTFSHHSPGCIVYFSPPKLASVNKTTDRFLDNKIAEETPDFLSSSPSSVSTGNNPVRSS